MLAALLLGALLGTLAAAETPAIPTGWSCDPSWYGDGRCDGNCGVMDIDCDCKQTPTRTRSLLVLMLD